MTGNARNSGRIKVGCCGFATSQQKYAELFEVIEVQQTFYQPPGLTTLERWRNTFPSNFEFTLKAWQLITHEAWSKTYKRLKLNLSEQERKDCGFFRDTPIVHHAWETTYRCALALNARLVLFQCPNSFKPTSPNIERMRSFFDSIERGELQLLWEPRGDWPDSLVSELCHELNLIHAVDPFVSSSRLSEEAEKERAWPFNKAKKLPFALNPLYFQGCSRLFAPPGKITPTPVCATA